MAWFKSSYLHALNAREMDRTDAGSADARLIKAIWNLDHPKSAPEKAPENVVTDIYRTNNSHAAFPSRGKRRLHRHRSY